MPAKEPKMIPGKIYTLKKALGKVLPKARFMYEDNGVYYWRMVDSKHVFITHNLDEVEVL